MEYRRRGFCIVFYPLSNKINYASVSQTLKYRVFKGTKSTFYKKCK